MTGQAQDAQGGDASFAQDLPFPGAQASPSTPLQAEFLQVQTTTDSRAEAVELARAAVAARYAACAQVAGPVASTYWWEGEMERAEEWLVTMKLPADRYADLSALLTRLHSYDEPEIIAMPICAGSAGYLGWIRDETRQPDTT
jgi:periplasmic divalent cation tolerance protein